jgi:hypothetical protein
MPDGTGFLTQTPQRLRVLIGCATFTQARSDANFMPIPSTLPDGEQP